MSPRTALFNKPHAVAGLHCNSTGTTATQQLGSTPDDDAGCVVCPNATLVAAVERAIRDDVITWHAFPFNANPEKARSCPRVPQNGAAFFWYPPEH